MSGSGHSVSYQISVNSSEDMICDQYRKADCHSETCARVWVWEASKAQLWYVLRGIEPLSSRPATCLQHCLFCKALKRRVPHGQDSQAKTSMPCLRKLLRKSSCTQRSGSSRPCSNKIPEAICGTTSPSAIRPSQLLHTNIKMSEHTEAGHRWATVTPGDRSGILYIITFLSFTYSSITFLTRCLIKRHMLGIDDVANTLAQVSSASISG